MGGDRSLAEFPANSQTARAPGTLLWRRTVSQIPTVFGRMVFLASLRDAATGKRGCSLHAGCRKILCPQTAFFSTYCGGQRATCVK
jgi:hypothetical protein